MQKAAFSIVKYQFDRVSIDLSQHHNSNDLKLTFKTKGLFIKSEKSFELNFLVFVKEKNAAQSFVEISCKGLFKFENINSFEEIPDFFYRNSIAILFPYVRSYLSIVTTQANVPGIILPTLNLSNLDSELRKNTTSKE